MEKSNVGKQVKVPINQLTLDIFKKYSSGRTRYDNIFPLSQRGCLVSNQKFNQHIKVIGEVVGLNRWVSRPSFTPDGKVKKGTDIREPLYKYITSHIMRRTFIREGINNNLPYHIIMSMSGHSNEKVFRGYFSTTEDELKDGGSKMFSLNIEPTKEVWKDEGVDELTKLISEMDEGKKKLFLQFINSMKEG
jgi:integrase